jgi:NADH-quinone oxidoreductase subunit I
MLKNILDKTYVAPTMVGMFRTLKRFFGRHETQSYPEEKRAPQPGYRGEHRIKKDEKGRPKCVACFMCQTACPAEAIRIVAGVSPWPDRDKVPVKFDLDLLKCIYCGMCQEACPCDAIELTAAYNVICTSRAEKVYDLEKLMSR